MKIAVNGLAARESGSATYLANILRVISENPMGHSWLVFAPYLDASDASRSERDWSACRNVEFVRAKICKTLIGRLFYEQFVIPRIARQKGAEVIFCISDIAPLWSKIPRAVVNMNMEIYTPEPFERNFSGNIRIKLLRIIGKISLRRALGIVSLSETAAKQLKDWTGITHKNWTVIHHGITEPKASESATEKFSFEPFILCVAGIYAHKNLLSLIEGFSQFLKQGGTHTLVVVGRVFNRKYFEKLIWAVAKYNIKDKVRFVGSLSQKNVAKYYKRANFFILPSRLESFGYPVLEAMAFGVPMALSDIESFGEIAGDASLYFNPQDPSSISQAMQTLATDADMRNKLSAKAKERVKNFSAEDEVGKIVSALEEWLR